MLVVLIVAMLLLVGGSMAVVLGAGPLLVVLFGLGAVAIWLAAAFLSGRTPADAIRETKPVEHLGPGGPDDPR